MDQGPPWRAVVTLRLARTEHHLGSWNAKRQSVVGEVMSEKIQAQRTDSPSPGRLEDGFAVRGRRMPRDLVQQDVGPEVLEFHAAIRIDVIMVALPGPETLVLGCQAPCCASVKNAIRNRFTVGITLKR